MTNQAAVRFRTSLCKLLLQSKQNVGSPSILCCHSNKIEYSKQRTDFQTVRNLSTFNIQTQIAKNVNIVKKNRLLYEDFMKIVVDQRRHAGHSHWQNIRHIKGAADKAKSALALQCTHRIRTAIREGGSADPKINTALARAMEYAKSKSVPNDTINRALKTAESSAASGKEEIIEGTGAGGLMFVIRSFTDKPSKARMEIQSRLKRYGASVGIKGTSMHSFRQTGIVEIELNEEDSRDHDDHIEMALEAEAEDVSMETREDGRDVLQFECNHLVVRQVKNYLESKGKNVIYAESVFIPLQTVSLTEQGMDNLAKLEEKLKEFDHVEEVFCNAVLQS